MQSKVVSVRGRPDLTFDVESGAIFCNDVSSNRAYEEKIIRNAKDKHVTDEIESLKSDMQDIKTMLQVLINNRQ